MAIFSIYIIGRQPINERKIAKIEHTERIKKLVSLYLDVFEIKLETELAIFQYNNKDHNIVLGEFEKNNENNYNNIENILKEANLLSQEEYNILMDFVRYFKTSKNLENRKDIEEFLKRVKKMN